MPVYTVDPVRFHAEGAVVNWAFVARRLGLPPANAAVVELRWMLDAAMGLPSGPFQVWARPHSAQAPSEPLTFRTMQFEFAGLLEFVTWNEGRMSIVEIDVQSTAGGTAVAFAGGPLPTNIVAFTAVAAGVSTVRLSAKFIDCLTFTSGTTIKAVRGVPVTGYANTAGWTLLEIVGLPVHLPQWAGVGKHGSPQGMVGALTDAPTAAVARLKRGAPPFGWGPAIVAGVPAPAWSAPDFTKLMDEVNSGLLDFLRDIVRNSQPDQQAAQTVTVALPPPQNSLGHKVNKPGSTTTLVPLPMSYMAAMSDPFLNLALGFGTAYPVTGDLGRVGGGNVLDYMITAHWEKGFNGASTPVDLAAVIPAPGPVVPPPAPANIATDVLGLLRPLDSNGPWRASVRTSWDRLPSSELFRVVSFAPARIPTAPPAPATALLQKRASGGYVPIGVNTAAHPVDPEAFRMHAIDREFPIPTNPGSQGLKYAVAAQDLYGQWTNWSSTDLTITQPALDPVRIAAAEIKFVGPEVGSVCPATLQVDFIWDWKIRSPKQVTFVGRFYPAATHGDPPPSVVVPAGLDRSLAGGGAPLTVTFSGDTPSAPGATFLPLLESGEKQSGSFGTEQGEQRRYRMTLSGISLDFASTPFVGLALWAQGQESIAPQRLTPWPDGPSVISTGDPRPPVIPVFHVKVGSIPDAAGESHVRIQWTTVNNAVGYFVYEASESSLLDAWGLPEPHPADTLDSRLKVVRDNLNSGNGGTNGNAIRKPFHRWNSRALTSTSTDVALPRGSKAIHCFVVLGISAGQVEGEWPKGPNAADSVIAVAAPHITKPAPPMIEAQQVLDGGAFKARLVITTRPGPRPAAVEIYRVRVDDAAREVDTMGPPIARLTATSGPWVVTTTADAAYGPFISVVQGLDAPSGSWRRVWYRATAWTGQDDKRGGLPGRSEPSNAAFVVVPPADGPSLSAISVAGGPAPADVLLQWTSSAPLKRTPLGPHLLSVRAVVQGAAPPPLLAVDTTLDAVGNAQPVTGSGVWIVSTVAGLTTYRALLRRAATTDVVNFLVGITDPLGRTGSQVLTIAAGPVNPPPDLENLKLQPVPIPPPGHLLLTFASTSPTAASLSGMYKVKITGVPLFPVFPPPLAFEIALGLIPKAAPVPAPPTYIVRSGAGPLFNYSLVTSLKMKSFVVRITAPDGTFVEKSV
jgi:hypothetical protein